MEKLIVNDSCIGCGLCVSQCEKYFEFNDEGYSKVKQEIIDEKDKKELLNIIESCPGQAIVIEEEVKQDIIDTIKSYKGEKEKTSSESNKEQVIEIEDEN